MRHRLGLRKLNCTSSHRLAMLRNMTNALLRHEVIKTTLPKAKELLKTGLTRAQLLTKGSAPWAASTGLLMKGYVSKIDGSVQPYVLLVPPEWTPGSTKKWRLDTWFHGRGETLSEVNMLTRCAHGRLDESGYGTEL